MDVTIPPNATGARVRARHGPEQGGRARVSGRALLAKNAPGVSLVGVEQGAVVFRVGSGDYRFVVGAGLFAATEVPGPSAAPCPPTLSLTLGAARAVRRVHAGRRSQYEASMTANVISTAGDAALSVSPQPAIWPTARSGCSGRCRWRSPRRRGRSGLQRGRGDRVQAADRGERALRTGTYSRTLTFTLSTTNP